MTTTGPDAAKTFAGLGLGPWIGVLGLSLDCRVLAKMEKESSADSRDMIYQEQDALESRSKAVYLRPKGKALKKRLALLK